jgi:hypothetical protein
MAAGPVWVKSALSYANHNCVEVAACDAEVLVRDSKDAGGPVLRFTRGEWVAFITSVKEGEFDLSQLLLSVSSSPSP